MSTLIRYSLQDLAAHWKLSLAMILLTGSAILIFLSIGGYRLTLAREYGDVPDINLIVQESNTLGELYGSRIPAAVETQLLEIGVSQAIPEIHDTIGTSVGDMLMLRGVDPQRYREVNTFELLSGKALQPGDPPRTALLGRRLAEKLGLSPGQEVLIRGRKFIVCGIFHTGTYADNEAWVSVAEAQALLGWGSDVSLFIIPDEGLVQPGDGLPGGLSVARRGQGARISISQITPLFNAMDVVIRALAVAAVLALTNILIRLAWLRRRELAILRCVGFQSPALGVYLFSQAFFLTFFGAGLGIAGTEIIFLFFRADLAGMSFEPSLDLGLALVTFGLALVLSLLGTILPIAWISWLKPGDILRSTS
ncbi:MAG: FtsX-like permease family protein [Chloroflexota bacterium]|nr:MAG: FtsX-like permease family protein [Chloroflexota bacterium]